MIRLHMIENRAKIEKQIFLGRQFIRKTIRKRVALPEPQSMLLQTPNATPSPSFDPRIPARSNSPPQTNSDHPLSVDTDAEVAFSRGSRWFFKRGYANPSPSTASGVATPNDVPAPDPLRSPAIRRKWTNELLSQSIGAASSSTHLLPTVPQYTSRPSASFISRLRTKSFPNLTMPFSSDPKRLSRESIDVADHNWSSDSSSEDDLNTEDRRQMRFSSSYLSDPQDGSDPPSEEY
ncbi:hypothetical protein DXG03_000385 [Asterophora parasitica]|uniref:Uncharacterized protein n=1 Tax=Asterophora parasitica TaxID=117018 RepID=A0A9P7KIU6_9AGAR|nr:hypothetical protein DXG03_000385 [Asterophora parasitica]